MKLLKRSTLNIEIAAQKKQQIDEGLLIARKVDALRQTLASLEQQQQKFVSGMEGELKLRTDKLLIEIASRKLEIAHLSEKKNKLIEDLKDEWDRLKNGQKVNEDTRDILAKGLIKLSDREKKIEEKFSDIKKTLARVNVRERELVKVYEKAEQAVKDTEAIKKEGLDKMVRIDKYITDKNNEISSRESKIVSQEESIKITIKNLEKERQDIIKEKAQLKDQRETLVRAYQRLKK